MKQSNQSSQQNIKPITSLSTSNNHSKTSHENRTFLHKLVIGAGLFCCLYGLIMIIIHAFTPFMLIWQIMGLLFIALGWFNHPYIGLTLIGLLIITCVLMANLYRVLPPPSYDATIVVLGTSVKDDRPSDELKARLDFAANLAKQHQMKIIVTGGKGADEKRAESVVSAEYLKQTYDLDCQIEDQSTNTYENLKYVQSMGITDTICIVSTRYHIPRACQMAKHMGFKHVTGIGVNRVDPTIILHLWLREAFAWGKALLLGQI